MEQILACFVPGIPQPQGSLKAFRHRSTGKVVVTSDNPKLKAWREAIAWHAQSARKRMAFRGEAVRVVLHFLFPRPKSHLDVNGRLRGNAPWYHTVRPDSDKLARGVIDALTKVMYLDDAQVAGHAAVKSYANAGGEPGVEIIVQVLA